MMVYFELKSLSLHLQKPRELFLCVEDHDHEGRPRNVFATPLDLDTVVSRLGRFILAQNGPILLRFALHFDPEST